MSNLHLDFKRTNPWRSLSDKIVSFAKKSSLVQRISPDFCPKKFLVAFIEAVITGEASLNEIAMDLEGPTADETNSTQALQQRITRTETGLEGFLLHCLIHVLNFRTDQKTSNPLKSQFKRILTGDSSFLRLLKKNAKHFPAHGNAHGQTAGAKTDLIFDLLTGEPIHADLYLGTEQDKVIGDNIFAYLQNGDLVLRDMGYFSVEIFRAIEEFGADWLSRLPLSVDVVVAQKTGQGKEVERTLEKVLQQTKGNRLDLEVSLSAQGHRTRLVAVRVSKQEAQKRRRERNAKAKEKGKSVSQKSRIRDGWHLMVTSVKEEIQSVEELCEIYRQRWQIEIVFRAWKQSSNLRSALNRVSSVQHLKGLMLAGILVMAMSLRMGLGLVRDHPGMRISLEKVFIYLMKKIRKMKTLKELWELDPTPIIRQLQTQSRKRKSLEESLLELLS
jgi:hypothetical protein